MRGWRLPLRIARREALRAKGRTILMLVMIALPVMGVTAADVLIQTQDVDSAESLDRRMGTDAAALVSVWGDRVAATQQSRDPESGGFGGGGETLMPAPNLPKVLKAIGGDRRGIEYVNTDLEAKSDRGVIHAGATEIDLHDSLARGLFDLTSGRLPANAEEVLVNQEFADRGPGVGETVNVTVHTATGEAKQRQLSVVGIAESTSYRTWAQMFGLAGTFQNDVDNGHSWLISGGDVRWDAVQRVNALGAVVLSRAEILDPSPAALAADEMLDMDSGIDEATLTLVTLVVVMALIEVVLLAGPAFAVGARRQARPLALLSASGGTPAQARRVVLATGVVVGTAGAGLGVLLGIAAAAALEPVFQHYSGSWFGPFEVPWLHLIGIAGFGFAAAILAAVVPAWIASRQDVVAVLAGRRGDRKPSGRSPFVGLALLASGAFAAWAGTGTVSTTSGLLIGVSAILSVLGMLFVVPVVVVAVARAGRWLPLALRFAVRDAARHRTRTTPAVAAVAATVAGVVAFGIGVTSDEAENRDTYQPSLAMGTASVSADFSSTVSPDWDAYIKTIEREAPGARARPLVGIPYQGADMASRSISLESAGNTVMPMSFSSVGSELLAYDSELPWSVSQVEDFPREAAQKVLDAGGAVVFVDDDRALSEITVRVTSYDEKSGEEVTAAKKEVAALVVNAHGRAPGIGIIPVSLAQQLGFEAATTAVFVDGKTITKDQEKNLQEALSAFPAPAYLYVERGYETNSETLIIQLVLAGLGGILMLGGTLTATFLALSDARPDLATLSAVGAAPRMRRGVAAGYALAVGGVGAVLGVMVGFVPGIAATYPLTSRSWSSCYGAECPPVADHYLDVPWLMIGGLVVVLPLLVAGVVWVFARSRLPLVARLS